MSDDLWSAFPLDPRDKAHAGLRASDQDRDRITGVLSSAFADGRLDRDELEERMAVVATARTLGELPPIVADLVPLKSPPARPRTLATMSSAEIHELALERWRIRRRAALLTFVTVLVVTAPFALMEIYWPLVIAALSLLQVVRVQATREEAVRDDVRRIQKKQARQQRWPKSLS